MTAGGASLAPEHKPTTPALSTSTAGPNPTHQVHQLPRDPPTGGRSPSLGDGWAALANPAAPEPVSGPRKAVVLCGRPRHQPPRTTFCPWENEVPSKGPPTNLNLRAGSVFSPSPRAPECAPGPRWPGAREPSARHGPPATDPGERPHPPPRPGPRPPEPASPKVMREAGAGPRRPAARPARAFPAQAALGTSCSRASIPARARRAPGPGGREQSGPAAGRNPRPRRPGGGRAGTHRAPRPARARA